MSRSSPAVLTACLLLASAGAWGKGVELASREYKLMLKAKEFAGSSPELAVERFVTERLVPAVGGHWNARAADELADKGLQLDERRIVRFRDTRDCSLHRHGFAWRERVDTDEQGTRTQDIELTLKFRSPDAFLAAGLPLEAREGARKAESKLEEDLSPVAVRKSTEEAFAARPRTARSQFSRSTKQVVRAGEVPTRLEGITELYPSFEEDFRAAAGRAEMSAALEPSPEYRELVYEGSKLDLTKGVKSAFALTLWYRLDDADQPAPALAEVSFKYDTVEGEVPREAARRALDLLGAMQDLPWADPTAPTKTALVACDRAS